MGKKQVFIKKLFNEQYTLTINMESMLITALLKSKTQARYDFTVLNIENNTIECRLVQLELFIAESNNNLVKEIAQVTAAFNRMYNELHLKLNKQGEILEVLNMDLIQSKWEETKTEMRKAASQNKDIEQLISINDNLFCQPEKIKTAIKANEFLQVYFGKVFGIDMPTRINETGTNLLNTTKLDWTFSIKETNENSKFDTIQILSEASPSYNLDSKFLKNAYQKFAEDIDFSNLSVELKQNANYQISEDTGKVFQSRTNKIEKVNSKLYMKISYNLVCDKITEKNGIDKNLINKQNTNKGESLIIEDETSGSTKKGGRWLIFD